MTKLYKSYSNIRSQNFYIELLNKCYEMSTEVCFDFEMLSKLLLRHLWIAMKKLSRFQNKIILLSLLLLKKIDKTKQNCYTFEN